MRLNPVWVIVLLLAACAHDPIDNPGTWRVPPKGLTSNDENLRAMLVNPHDIVVGQGEPNAVGVTAARGVRRLLTGKRAALPNATTSRSVPASGPEQQQGAGASTSEE